MAAKILVIDDDRRITALLRRTLVFEGYEVQVAGRRGRPAACGLLAAGPDFAGRADARPGRLGGMQEVARSGSVPVLMLTARDEVSRTASRDWTWGLTITSVKPFALEELLARIRALLRRKKPDEPVLQPLVYEDLTLDHTTREVHRGDRLINLTAREFDLLALFMENPRQVLTRDLIMERVWGYDFSGESNVLEVYIGMLRQKLEEGGERRLIHTRRGVGYVLK